jgi:Protein of unknown function (DUF3800)
MSWLLFMDESGHDHKALPMEVRGGIALHVSKVWHFFRAWKQLEYNCFGTTLAAFGKEAKGYKLLDKDRFKWARQAPEMTEEEQRRNARIFLERGTQKLPPTAMSMTAYGRASLEMARGVFDLLASHDAKLFAAAIPRGTRPPAGFANEEYLRKDHVFLFERFYYFLESQNEHGLIIMDQSEKRLDQTFVRQMETYFSKTATGRNRASRIVPSPLFVDSDMTFGVQAADICLYCLNWGFRLDSWNDVLDTRPEIAQEFGPKLARLQWTGTGIREGEAFRSYGIVLVNDPYQGRQR